MLKGFYLKLPFIIIICTMLMYILNAYAKGILYIRLNAMHVHPKKKKRYKLRKKKKQTFKLVETVYLFICI